MAIPFETVVAPDAAETTRRMGRRLVELASASRVPPFTVALSGGGTPRLLYRTLAADPFRSEMPWDRVELFFGDERAVPPSHGDSNFRMVKEALLDHVPVRAHRMAAEADDAAAYEKLLAERVAEKRGGFPVLDVVLLGVGKDGHTASLFPGTPALDETARWVVMNDVPQLDTRRMTLTYPVINNARHVWILATGADKREIVGACLAAAGDAEAQRRWPVLGVRPTHGELVWWLDETSAGG
jgi:6-phosphogluconolactonase